MRALIVYCAILLSALTETGLAKDAPVMPVVGIVSRDTPNLSGNAPQQLAKGTAVNDLFCLTVSDTCFASAGNASVKLKGSDISVAYDGKTTDAHAAALAFYKAMTDVNAPKMSLPASAPLKAQIRHYAIAGEIVAWGDSLTDGRNPLGQFTPYTKFAENMFGNGTTVLNRGKSGDKSYQVLARFMREPSAWSKPTWIWVGRNNYQDVSRVESDIDEMVKRLGHDRYIVASVLGGEYYSELRGRENYAVIAKLNQHLKDRYGDHYLDIHAAVMQHADPVADKLYIEEDIVPRRFRLDQVHLTEEGSKIVAAAFVDASKRLEW